MKSKKNGKIFFFYMLILFFLCTLPFLSKVLLENRGEMKCIARAIMHFEDPNIETVNANIHFHFASKGQGSMVVEGYSDSKAGWLYLQRYVKFEYDSQQISNLERMYKVKKWSSSKSSIDEAPDVIFDYFMREMSDSNHALQIHVKKLNHSTVLLSSINSPLFICSLSE